MNPDRPSRGSAAWWEDVARGDDLAAEQATTQQEREICEKGAAYARARAADAAPEAAVS